MKNHRKLKNRKTIDNLTHINETSFMISPNRKKLKIIFMGAATAGAISLFLLGHHNVEERQEKYHNVEDRQKTVPDNRSETGEKSLDETEPVKLFCQPLDCYTDKLLP